MPISQATGLGTQMKYPVSGFPCQMSVECQEYGSGYSKPE